MLWINLRTWFLRGTKSLDDISLARYLPAIAMLLVVASSAQDPLMRGGARSAITSAAVAAAPNTAPESATGRPTQSQSVAVPLSDNGGGITDPKAPTPRQWAVLWTPFANRHKVAGPQTDPSPEISLTPGTGSPDAPAIIPLTGGVPVASVDPTAPVDLGPVGDFSPPPLEVTDPLPPLGDVGSLPSSPDQPAPPDAGTSIPEPGSLALFAWSAIILHRRRR